jgi:long-chain acyl-CoA synthetase
MIASKKELNVEKIWLKSYDEGVPETIEPEQYTSIVDLAQECFLKFADKPCYANLGTIKTYEQIDSLSQCFAGFLQSVCGLNQHDRVAIMLPNTLQYPVALFGALRAGMTIVNVNPLYTPRELIEVLNDSGAQCVIVLANFAHVLEKALPETKVSHVIVTEIGDLLGGLKGIAVNLVVKYIKKMVPKNHIVTAYSFKEAIRLEHQRAFKKVDVKSEDIAFLQYTGGTTGGYKGAMLTHRNMVANMLQACAWITPFFNQKIEGGIITALPLYHIFSLTANCLTFLKMGIHNILITNPRDIPGFVKELKRQPFAVMTGVNTLFNTLLHNKAFCRLDFSKLKFTLGGGMAVQKAVADKWQEITGVMLLEAYGLTEASPAVTINPLSLKSFNGSIGLPLSSMELPL